MPSNHFGVILDSKSSFYSNFQKLWSMLGRQSKVGFSDLKSVELHLHKSYMCFSSNYQSPLQYEKLSYACCTSNTISIKRMQLKTVQILFFQRSQGKTVFFSSVNNQILTVHEVFAYELLELDLRFLLNLLSNYF